MKGKVKWYNRVKGFGFLTPDDGSTEVFVHYSSIQGKGRQRELTDGQGVEFEVVQGPKGPTAAQVKPEAKPAPAA